MSEVDCGHVCQCDCSIHRAGGATMHNFPCCDGERCPICRKFIKSGMMKDHLTDPVCHSLTEEGADHLIRKLFNGFSRHTPGSFFT